MVYTMKFSMMKWTAALLTMVVYSGVCSAAEHAMHHGDGMMHMPTSLVDLRIPLNLTPEMKQHQLSNMRSHMQAIHKIVTLISQGEFEKAAGIAHNDLGLTAEMQRMCGMSGNAKFTELGLAFHTSADELGEVLMKKDVGLSLQALSKTTGYCVECHAAFRQ
jgi:hypothetical protein